MQSQVQRRLKWKSRFDVCILQINPIYTGHCAQLGNNFQFLTNFNELFNRGNKLFAKLLHLCLLIVAATPNASSCLKIVILTVETGAFVPCDGQASTTHRRISGGKRWEAQVDRFPEIDINLFANLLSFVAD